MSRAPETVTPDAPSMLRYLIPAAVALAPAAPAASAQPDARRADSTLATLVTPNGEMRLTLTSRSLFVGFTALGQRRIRRAADSAFAATYGAKGTKSGRPERADDVLPSPGDVKADPRGDHEAGPEKPGKPLPLRDVESVRASGDSLLLCFASHSGPGLAAPPCSMWRRFVVTGLPPADAQRFAEAVRRARAASVGARN